MRTVSLLCAAFITTIGCSQPATTEATDASAGSDAADSTLVAEVDGKPITLSELDAWIKEDMFRRAGATEPALYALRETALHKLVSERAVAAAAQAAGVSEEQLVADRVAALGPVTDDEVQAFYDENAARFGNPPFESVADQIREALGAMKSHEVKTAIEKDAEVVIHLDPPRVDVAPDGPARGPADAPITIVEFSDFECPYCRRVLPTIEEIVARYPEQVRVVFRNFPLDNHRRARPAAEAALCANEQGKFWPYHDVLFENARELGDADLVRYAGEVGLDVAAFEACVGESRFAEQVETDFQAGRAAGVSGTPAFFVNGVLLSGARPTADFARAIDAELKRLGSGG